MTIIQLYIDNRIVTKLIGGTNDRTEKLGITLPVSLLRRIYNIRGDIPRSTYTRGAAEKYFKVQDCRSDIQFFVALDVHP